MKKLTDYIAEAEQTLAEKAVSQQQQKFMGMVHAVQKGEKVKGASPALKKAAAGMSKRDAKDFASTPHKGLPKKVTEAGRSYDLELEIINPEYEAWENGAGDEDNAPDYVIDVGVNYSISGRYAPASWGYHGGSPEEHPEIDEYKVYNLATGQELQTLSRSAEEDIEAAIWKDAESSADDYDDFDDYDVREDAVSDFVSRGGNIQHGKYRGPRKSEKTDYGSKHIGTVGGKGGRGTVTGKGANTRVGAKPVVMADMHSEGHDYSNLEDNQKYVIDAESGKVVDGPFSRVSEIPLRLMGFDGAHKIKTGAELKNASTDESVMPPVAESIDAGASGTFDHICKTFSHECKRFKESNGHDLDRDLFHALYDYYFDDMPYGIKKDRDGDSFEWVSERFHNDLGLGHAAPASPVGGGDLDVLRKMAGLPARI